MARQADGSVTVSCGSNVVLVTTVVKKSVSPGQDFFPLSVHYLEKTYAAGKIPGGFLRREGRPSEEQILISRLIDRSIRPSFPDGFFNEIQIVATVVSYDGSFSPDMLALIGASASLALTGAPYEDIIAGVRVGFVNGKYTLNPNKEDLKESALDLVVSGTDDAILMVESEAKSLPESVMLGGILYAHKHLKTIISSINKLAKVAAKPAMEYTVYEINKILKAQIKSNFFGEIKHAYSFASKQERNVKLSELRKKVLEYVYTNDTDNHAYPYVVRIVSEILESNGSSSMATVCGSSLSMMDAGVPIAEPVAGIAMGLIKDGSKYAVLSDILGDEDHLGDMDFKVAGTRYGVTALQMDIKIKGISRDILEQALEQARSGRLHILGIMNEVIKEHKETVSNVAPQIHVMNIKPAKIKDVVGRGGSTVKGIAEKTGAQIDTSDTGEVKIFARDKASLDMAVMMVEEVVAEAEEGQVYKGKIVKILDSGAFVNLFGKQDGYLPFADVEQAGIKTNSLSEGQPLEVVVQAVDRMGRVKVGIVKR
ncbi:UNVERIFIED_CONTAM: hypothetical protein GTU68_041253 [Idotea baltica]|nr:hypothetical protein [Idotea baltica]